MFLSYFLFLTNYYTIFFTKDIYKKIYNNNKYTTLYVLYIFELINNNYVTLSILKEQKYIKRTKRKKEI